MKRILFIFSTLLFFIIMTTSILADGEGGPIFVQIPSYLLIRSDRDILHGQTDSPWGLLWTTSYYYESYNGRNSAPVYLRYHYYGKNWSQWYLKTFAYEGMNGFFVNDWKPRENTWYQAYFEGDGGTKSSTSSIAKTNVRVKISGYGVKSSDYYKIYGGINPSKARRYVEIKVRRSGDVWKVVKYAKLNSDSRYSYRYYFPKKGTYFIKAAYAGDKHHSSNSTATKRFVVN